jgi:hypothetical protein
MADSFLVGTWLSLVEHSLGVRGVGSSNLPVPTKISHCYRAFSHFCVGSLHAQINASKYKPAANK